MKRIIALFVLLQLIPGLCFSQNKNSYFEAGQAFDVVSDSSEVFHILENSDPLENAILEFDMTPLNSHGHFGAVLRYSSDDSWIYLGCDMSDDLFGRAVWFITTPETSVVFAKDINKPYEGIKRHIRIKYLGNSVTLWVEGEEVIHRVFPCKVTQNPGKIGFRAWNGGKVKIENVKYEACHPLKPEQQTNEFYTISSDLMEVKLDPQFPRVKSYKWLKNSEKLYGETVGYNYITINGKDYVPVIGLKNKTKGSIGYKLEIEELNVSIDLKLFVEENYFGFKVLQIKERGEEKVRTFGFPKNRMVSVGSHQPNASLSVAKYAGNFPNSNVRNSNVHQEEFFKALKNVPADYTNATAGLVIINTDKLAATIDNNVLQNFNQFRYQTYKANNGKYTGIWNQDWIYRGFNGEITGLPWAKVYITDDRNSDNLIDWQDGAIALREHLPELDGAGKLRNSFSHIGKIEGSMVQYTFLRWLDYLKKINLLTDGFGQIFLIKGYQSEGHDSSHPDYGSNYNKRAGGYNDLKFLFREAKEYNAEICLHINHSESYPEAKSFDKEIVSDIPAWLWWDQSYFIIRKTDIFNGTFRERIEELHQQLPELKFVYLDTYREERWIADYTARLFKEVGWAFYTEDNSIFDRHSSWVHYSPGGTSKISRFIFHQNKDAYQSDPLLYGGYDSRKFDMLTDLGGMLDNFMTQQLPYRYLMHFPLMKWTEEKALFAGNVQSTLERGKTVIRKNGKKIVDGKDIFIPWDPVAETKIYCYSGSGEKKDWELPGSWQNKKEVFLYELSDLGKTNIQKLNVSSGKVQLELKESTPYVLYREQLEENQKVTWGAGSLVKDMGFDSKGFNAWNIAPSKGGNNHIGINTSGNGNAYLDIEGEKGATVEQKVNGLEGDKVYFASVWAEVSGDKKAVLSVVFNDGKGISNYMLQGGVPCTVPSQKKGNWQKMRVRFKMPENQSSATIQLAAGKGNADSFVRFDDVRLFLTEEPNNKAYAFYEDFEHVDEGVYPFIPAGFGTKIHLSEKNPGYTKDALNGKYSLKVSAGNGNGLVAQTLPCNLRFKPRTGYSLSFIYQANLPGAYRVVLKSRKGGNGTVLFDELLGKNGKFIKSFKTGKEDDYYISIFKEGDSELILDDIKIEL